MNTHAHHLYKYKLYCKCFLYILSFKKHLKKSSDNKKNTQGKKCLFFQLIRYQFRRVINVVCLKIEPYNIYRWAWERKQSVNKYKQVSSISSIKSLFPTSK